MEEKNNKDAKILLLTNEEKNDIVGIIVNGKEYYKKKNQTYSRFLAEVICSLRKSEGIDIYPQIMADKYTNITSMTKENYDNLIKPEERKVKAKRKTNNNLKKKVAALTTAAVLAISTIGLIGCNAKSKTDKTEVKSKAEVATEITKEDLSKKSLEELIGLLSEKNGQKDTIQKMVDTQEYFNNVAAPSISIEEDAGARLYLTEDEILSTYTYLNILNEGPEKLSKIFGDSNAIWINKAKEGEAPIYVKISKEQIENDFESMAQVVANYYKYGVEPTGLTNLFENEKEQEFYSEFEELVLEYNETKSEKAEDAIHNAFKNIFGSDEIDPLYEKYPGACALIARAAVPALKENGVVCEKGYANIMNIYKCEIKPRIDASVLEMDELQTKTKNDPILNEIYKKMDKDLIGVSRNIKDSFKIPNLCENTNCITPCEQKEETEEVEEIEVTEPVNYIEKRTENAKRHKEYITPKKPNKPNKKKKCDYYKYDKNIKIPEYNDPFKPKKETKKITEKESTITKDRSVVEKKHSESEIRKAEQEADKKANIKDKNESENKRAEDIQRGNNDAVDDFVNNKGETGKPSNNESQDYKDQYNKTNQDLEDVKKQQEEYDKSHSTTKTEVVEEKHYDNDGNEKQEAPKQEAPKQEAPKQEASKQEAPKQEAPKQEAPKQDKSEDSTSKDTSGIKLVKSVTIAGLKYKVENLGFGERYVRARK